ncbi:MAG TPA: trypsin-like serine protease [Solirubrobacterales bacterium]|nr:trypsin-like serine protease [Solirubrobacterales bacterium]
MAVLGCAIALLALALPAVTAARDGATASIIAGRAATIEEFPSLAYIEAHEGKSGFACTGTVVAPRVILTAAHCVEDIERGRFTPANQYAVATGTTAPGKAIGTNVFRVVETHVFPGFDPGNLRGDAGILVLDRPTAAPPIALAGAGDAALYEGGATIQLAGWGLTKANATDGPGSLRATSMVVQRPSFCKQKTRDYYPPYSAAGQLCTLDVPARRSGGCYGDSGGPAIGQRADGTPVEVGIISTGGPFCSTKLPNVLIRADFIAPWVAEWIAAIETGAPRPVTDPSTPFPLMTRPVAEAFTIYTLQDAFGNRFERAKRVLGGCRRVSRSRFRCEVTWRSGRNVYAGVVSPFYVRRSQGVVWNSRFKIEWAALKCLRTQARCPIRTKRG